MRVKDLAEFIASLPQDQNVKIIVRDYRDIPHEGSELIGSTLNQTGIRQIVFANPKP